MLLTAPSGVILLQNTSRATHSRVGGGWNSTWGEERMRMVVAGSGMAHFHNVRRLPTWAILTKLSFVVRVGESIHALV